MKHTIQFLVTKLKTNSGLMGYTSTDFRVALFDDATGCSDVLDVRVKHVDAERALHNFLARSSFWADYSSGSLGTSLTRFKKFDHYFSVRCVSVSRATFERDV